MTFDQWLTLIGTIVTSGSPAIVAWFQARHRRRDGRDDQRERNHVDDES